MIGISVICLGKGCLEEVKMSDKNLPSDERGNREKTVVCQ